MNKTPLIWASVLRIIACAMIFAYHFLVLTSKETYSLGAYGLYIFFFLAGWFAAVGRKEPWEWLKGRIRRILIPYWPVIFVVLIANRVVGYKETTLLKDVMIFSGLSLFVENPVYVISWFITMIIMLDISFFLFRKVPCKYWKPVFLVVLYLFFQKITPRLIRPVMLFYIGAGLSLVLKNRMNFSHALSERFSWFRGMNEIFYTLQSYTYSFFLIHGAVLIFIFKLLNVSGASAFFIALVLSLLAAFIHNRLLRKFA